MVSLFGGAITATLPPSVIDVSSFRQVPDNQEVFLLELNDPKHDKSIIIELLETPSPDIFASFRLHLSDVTEQEEISDIHYQTISTNSKDTRAFLVYNHQDITIIMGVVRLAQVGTDVLVTMNVPRDRSLPHGNEYMLEHFLELSIGESVGVVKGVVGSLRVEDWDLFT